MKSVLLAPTGRAAKVLASHAGKQAFTIHRKIYRQKSLKDGTGSFVLDRNLSRNTYFIVDESSMISNTASESSVFGSGSLLDDLLEYVYSGTDCRLILVGDNAQLPPVGSVVSPALDRMVLEGYGFGIIAAVLRHVVRQSESSGVLMNATNIRLQVSEGRLDHPLLDCRNYKDVVRISGENLIEELSDSYGACGLEETIFVVNSNIQANI